MCSWVMSRGELAPEGFEAAEWQRFDTLCEGPEGVMDATEGGRAPAYLRTSMLRQTASVRESVPTSNPESGKRWNEAKVRNGQSLTSAHRNGCHCGHRPRSPASVLATATGPLPPSAVPLSRVVTGNLTRDPAKTSVYEVRGHVTHPDII